MQNHHKTQAQLQKMPHHACADWQPLSLGSIQNSSVNKVCIKQVIIKQQAANDEVNYTKGVREGTLAYADWSVRGKWVSSVRPPLL